MTDQQTNVTQSADLVESPVNRRRRRRWPWIALTFLLAIVTYNAWVTLPVRSALADEKEYSVLAYRRWLISPSSVVFDVRGVEGTASMVGMDRALFKAAEALKDRDYDQVILAHRGTAKFILDGARFNTIGQERSSQNPIYVIRTIQQDIKNMDGSPAFGTLSGGWLGVLGAEMEQHNEFHQKWWVEDETGRMSASGAGL